MKSNSTLQFPFSAGSPLLVSLTFAAMLSGCGGSTSDKPDGVVPVLSRFATAPPVSGGVPVFGFDADGKPVYLIVDGTGKRWTVSASDTAPLYSIDLPGVTDSTPKAVSGKYLSGSYDDASGSGTVVAFRKPDGTPSVAFYAGFSPYMVNGGQVVVTEDATDKTFLLDIATGAKKELVLPSGYDLWAIQGTSLLCRSSDRKSFIVFDRATKSSVPLVVPAGCDSIYAESVSADGQVFGLGRTAAGGVDVRLWNKAGVPGPAVDSITGLPDYIEGAKISKDGTKMLWSKRSGSVTTAFMRNRGVNYDLSTAALKVSQLGGLNDPGTFGLAQAKSEFGASEWITAKIEYVKP